MKRKKLLSTAVAGMLVAAQMVMPVMAADGGTVDVEVTTKDVVIRVAVPTSLEIAVNQFEKGDAGSQITSGNFTIQNKSEIPVKMTVTSIVDLAATNPIGLVPTKAAAEGSTAANGEAWLAVAAMVDTGKYEATADAGNTKIGTLTEASANVTTFALVNDNTSLYDGKNAAEQTFYLAADTAATPTYADVRISDADSLEAAKKIAYAQFYKVTEMGAQPATDAALQALVDIQDVALIIPGAASAADTVTVLKKGETGVALDNTSGAKYYDIADDPTNISSMAAPSSEEIYIYGEVTAATTGGDAGFRFIGKLSDKESWTAADITDIHINYDIKGVTDTKYGDVSGDCIYGLYGGAAASVVNPSITSGATAAASGAGHDYEATFTKGTALTFAVDFGNSGAASITSAEVGVAVDNVAANTSIVSVSGRNVTIAGNSWAAAASGSVRYCKITLDDGTELVVKITFA